MLNEMTGTFAAMPFTSLAFSNLGSSMEGMPSFGGPSPLISSKLTAVLEKSVFGHSNFQISGLAEAL
jgi:formate hydrogenlyase subunit 3/multisubunit Na+/H+ antiporter MnhD subunit